MLMFKSNRMGSAPTLQPFPPSANCVAPPFALRLFPSDRISSFKFRVSPFLPTAIMEFETPAGRSYTAREVTQ